MHESEKWKWSYSVLSNPQRPHGLQPSRLLHPWDFPGKSTGVGCHCLLQCMKLKWKVKSLSHIQLLATPWTAAYQAPPSMGFSRQEYPNIHCHPSNADLSLSSANCRFPVASMISPLDSPTTLNSNIQLVGSHWLMGPALNRLSQWLSSKESTCNTEDSGEVGSIPGPGISPGGGHGNPFQYSCLENPIDRGVWQSTVHGVAKSQTQLKWLSTHAPSTPSSKHIYRDVPGGPEAKTLCSQSRGPRLDPCSGN